ncbi:MAG: hypothetical protein ACOX1V_03010 [Candidatus Iainarchaeum sp.]|jgi:hypothetical protein|nr:MAG: hypothetical protein BWY55_00146 [archaeon ADurb.Bin336]
MTLNNSLLILIKQNPGITYNDIHTKFASRYKNPASAKSALMRGLKDMTSFGLIKKDGLKFFITDKGLSSMSVEMKDKLVLKLNQSMKKPIDNLDELVKLLVVLLQRGAEDSDLLRNAKDNSAFTINDLVEVRKEIRSKRKYLKKMGELLDTQIEKLKEIDFNDSLLINFDADFVDKLIKYCNGQKILVETKDESILSKVPSHWIKQNTISVEGSDISLLIQLILASPWAKVVIYVPGVKINLMAGKASIFGSHKTISEFYSNMLVNMALDENNY